MEIGNLFLNRYEIIEKIGEGGMSYVYKAHCKILDRFVAIKILKDEFVEDSEFIAKFLRESKAAAKLNHPNIVGIYDYHETVTDGKTTYAIVMEYVEGTTLKDLIKQNGKLPENECIDLSLQILNALREAHSHGIVHRDISPQNIIITKNNIAKVTDFGIARISSSHTMTTTMEAIGSVYYFSPEQARGAFTDQRTDIYSFGIVLYEMITGQRPFTGENPITIAMKHINDEITSPSQICEISQELERVIFKCTEKKQASRFQNVNEIITILKSLKNGGRTYLSSDEIDDYLDKTQLIPEDSLNEILNYEKNKKKEKEQTKNNKNSLFIVDANESDDNKEENVKSGEDIKIKNMNEKRNKISFIPIVLGILVAFLITTGVFIGLNYFSKNMDSVSSKNIVMPSLIGKSVEDAEKILKEYDIKLEVERTISDSSRENGITNQKPQPNIEVKTGSVVYVTVNNSNKSNASNESSEKIAENYIGKNIEDVKNMLIASGINVETTYVENKETEKDTIINQNPPAGEKILNNTIKFELSSGEDSEKATMPNIVGLNVEEAKKILNEKGLNTISLVYQFSDETEKDIVMSQTVQANTEISKDTTIEITVSKGKEENVNLTEPNTDTNSNTAVFSLSLKVPQEKEETLIQLVRDVNGEKTTVYEKNHTKDEEFIYILLEDQPVGSIIELYYDGILQSDYVVEG